MGPQGNQEAEQPLQAGLLRRMEEARPGHERVCRPSLFSQVTLSYGGPENPRNVVNVAGGFSLQQDPTR